MTLGPGRLTAGLNRAGRLDLAGHRATFGTTPALTQAELISWTREVDLRGRGGAAFPFARKLTAVAEAAQRRRGHPVVVVNATEGEPGSIKDKMLLSRSPYLVLTGALVAARALGARRIVIGVAGQGPHLDSIEAAVAADPSCGGWCGSR